MKKHRMAMFFLVPGVRIELTTRGFSVPSVQPKAELAGPPAVQQCCSAAGTAYA